jgi:hypothetical protein
VHIGTRGGRHPFRRAAVRTPLVVRCRRDGISASAAAAIHFAAPLSRARWMMA